MPEKVPYSSNCLASSKNIFDDNLEKYFGVENNGPKETQFINHFNGERIKVNNEKLTNDPKYFTNIVAQLAKSDIENTLYKLNSKTNVSIRYSMV